MPDPATPLVTVRPVRVRIFVDYWNFQLTLNERAAASKGLSDYRFQIDWRALGPWLAKRACEETGLCASGHSFDGAGIYVSYDPRKESDKRFFAWVNTWLSRQPGVMVECRERKPKAAPNCPECHQTISDCPHCKRPIRPSQEKGVDTLIATDMIRLAWEDGYDLAVLATSDRDLIPAVEFLNKKGHKVVQAGFPPKGSDLARASWASFDAFKRCSEIERPSK
jgi:uncharacterized LabA/DUF88 family protein